MKKHLSPTLAILLLVAGIRVSPVVGDHANQRSRPVETIQADQRIAPAAVDSDSLETGWVGTWATALQLTEPRNLPPEPGLAGNTLRQIVRVSLGGEKLRFRFSNEFGTSPVVVSAAHVALSLGEGAIDPATDQALTFGGNRGATIPAGGAIHSDTFRFSLEPRSDLAVTIHFGAIDPDIITGHPGSRTTSFLVEDDAVSAASMPDASTTDHWYIISDIDVERDGAASVVTLGNSITDGRGSGTNKQNRWPDVLSERLLADPATRNVAVLNAGIGGNCVLKACLGPSALDRFDRDVLRQDGVRFLIILEGVNDIGTSAPDSSAVVARRLIASFQTMIAAAHERGILVYGATILPIGGSFYDSPEHEKARETVNEWIRTSGSFDAVIDLDRALRDPSNPAQLLPTAHMGDLLHPNELGHRLMAEAVDLSLFKD